MQKVKDLFMAIWVLCLLTACNFSNYPNGDYAKVTYQEINEGVESGELIEVEEEKIENIVSLLKDANWDYNAFEMAYEADGKLTLVSESESNTEHIYVWFETTNEKTILSVEEGDYGELSKEKGQALKDLLSQN